MAEINIEPKKRSGWSWIIVLLILVLIGWLLYRYFFESKPGNPDMSGAPTTSWVVPMTPTYPAA